MTKIDGIFRAVRFDYAVVWFLQSFLFGALWFLSVFFVGSIVAVFGLRYAVFGYPIELAIAFIFGVVAFLLKFSKKLFGFSYRNVGRMIPGMDDLLQTVQEYKRKDNVFKEQLYHELHDAANNSTTAGLLDEKLLYRNVVIILLLVAGVAGTQYLISEYPDYIASMIPQFIKDVPSDFGIVQTKPDVVIKNDDSIYGDPAQILQPRGNPRVLELNSGSSGGNFNAQDPLIESTFDHIYDTDSVQAIIEETEVQKLPADISLAKEYSIKVKAIG